MSSVKFNTKHLYIILYDHCIEGLLDIKALLNRFSNKESVIGYIVGRPEEVEGRKQQKVYFVAKKEFIFKALPYMSLYSHSNVPFEYISPRSYKTPCLYDFGQYLILKLMSEPVLFEKNLYEMSKESINTMIESEIGQLWYKRVMRVNKNEEEREIEKMIRRVDNKYRERRRRSVRRKDSQPIPKFPCSKSMKPSRFIEEDNNWF